MSSQQHDQEESQVLLMDREWERQQIRSFTAWINFQLKKIGLSISDIGNDLRDGRILIRLLEVISADKLPPAEKKNLRLHQINNVNRCLDFISKKNVKLAGTGAEEIVDGNLKMTLGLIWCVILRFAIQSSDELVKNDGLLLWVRKKTENYRGVNVTNFTSSFKDGLAFNALIHRHRPDLLKYDELTKDDPAHNLQQAFDIADKHLGIPCMLGVEDTMTAPDQKSVMTYISAFYHEFSKNQVSENASRRILKVLDTNAENARKIEEYERIASDLLKWINNKTDEIKGYEPEKQLVDQLIHKQNEMKKYLSEEKPPKSREKAQLENLLSAIKTRLTLQKRPDFVPCQGHSLPEIQNAWDNLNNKEKILLERLAFLINQLRMIDHLLKKFRIKCDQQDNWTSGKMDSLTVNVEDKLMPEILILKQKLTEFGNDASTREPRIRMITSLYNKLKEFNCREMPEVEQRYAKVNNVFNELLSTHKGLCAKVDKREEYLKQIDELKHKYATLAYGLTTYFDLSIEDLEDTYQVQSVSEIESLIKELEEFRHSIPPQKVKLLECSDVECKIKEANDNPCLYCSVTGDELRNKLAQLDKIADARKVELDNELQLQIEHDKLRKSFADLADKIDNFRKSCLERVQGTSQSNTTFEDQLIQLKKVAEEIETFYHQKLPEIDSLSKTMHEKNVPQSPFSYTNHTFESINSDYQSLFDTISANIREIENSIIVRDSSNLTEQQVKDYKKSFDYFDRDKQNFLGYAEFRDFLISLEFNVTAGDPAAEREFAKINSKVDPEQSGRITFNSFLNFVASESKDTDNAEQIIESFRVLAGGKEYITPEIIKQQLPERADMIISKMEPSKEPDAPAGALDYKSFSATLYGESEL